MNRAKLGCTINLRDADGKKLLAQLAANSNVVVDNFSSGVLERLGFGFDDLRQINPGIVQAVMPGWGLQGRSNPGSLGVGSFSPTPASWLFGAILTRRCKAAVKSPGPIDRLGNHGDRRARRD